MRIMGLDLGEKTIGIAISDALQMTAQPLTTLMRQEGKELERLEALICEYGIERVVVGLPRNMNGSLGPQAERAQEFGRALEAKAGVPVTFWDERLTTVAAERVLLEADLSRRKRKKVIDQVSAAVMLEGYLKRISAGAP